MTYENICTMASAHRQNHSLPLRTIFQYNPNATTNITPLFTSFPVPSNRYITAVAAGLGFWLYADDDGSLHSWGYNSEFQRLGVSQPASFQTEAPNRVPLPHGIRIVDCAAGGNHSLCLTDQGDVYAFGSNESDQLGIDHVEDVSPPCRVPLPQKVQSIYCGWDFSVALLSSGNQVMTWGNSRDGQLGQELFGRSSLPKKMQLPGKVVQMSAGYAHVAVILRSVIDNEETQKVMTWGSDGLALNWGTNIRAVKHLPEETIVQVSAGKSYTLFRSCHGLLYAAGSGEEGQLGLGDHSGRSYAAVIPNLLNHHVVNVSAGAHHAVAITKEGQIFAWGRIFSGNKRRSLVPVQLSTFPEFALRSFPFSQSSVIVSNAGSTVFCLPLQEDLDPAASVCRPMRQLARDALTNKELLPKYLLNANVYHKCEHGRNQEFCERSKRCTLCSIPYYISLLAGRSDVLRERLLDFNGDVLYFSQYPRDVVFTVLSLFQSGYICPETKVSTIIQVLPILVDLKVPHLEKLAHEFWERRVDNIQFEVGDSFSNESAGQSSNQDDNGGAQKNECAICINSLTHGIESVVQLSCSHKFHATCLAIWARRKGTCPICRAPLGSIESNRQLRQPVQYSDIWDRIYSQGPELSDELKYRRFVSELNQQDLRGQISVNIILCDVSGAELHLGRFDAFQLAIHSKLYRNIGDSNLSNSGDSGNFVWRVPVKSQRSWQEYALGMTVDWLSGMEVKVFNITRAHQVVCGEVISLAHSLGMEQLQKHIEAGLVANIWKSIEMTTFARLLEISRETGAALLRNKLCTIADQECADLQLEYAKSRAKVLASQAKKLATSWNVAASAVASKSPVSLRRNRVFCEISMTDAKICEAYKEARCKNMLIQSDMIKQIKNRFERLRTATFRTTLHNISMSPQTSDLLTFIPVAPCVVHLSNRLNSPCFSTKLRSRPARFRAKLDNNAGKNSEIPPSQPLDSSSPTVFALLSAMSKTVGDVSNKKLQPFLQEMRSVLNEKSADLSDAAMLATMRALGAEPFDGEMENNQFHVPSFPPFDPTLALVLAGYSFRAYLDPPGGSYREMHATEVAGTAISGMDRQLITTEFSYPDTAPIKRISSGLFMIHIEHDIALDQVFITSSLNGAICLDVMKMRTFSVLRKVGSETELDIIPGHDIDDLTLSVYTSEKAYADGKSPFFTSTFSLHDIAEKGLETMSRIDGEEHIMRFETVSEENKRRNYFELSLLPAGLKLPFYERNMDEEDESNLAGVKESTVKVQATFVPFEKSSAENAEDESTLPVIPEEEQGQYDHLKELSAKEVAMVLQKQLAPGELPSPSDWKNIVNAAKALIHREEDNELRDRFSVAEDLPGTLFVESLDTDTEVWFFRDEKKKNIVISFRGTEQVKWRDFFTDAQLFLQLWTPGEEINLNIEVNRTVGLPDILPSVMAAPKSAIPEDSSAVHYGFLRAYYSVREGVRKALDMLTFHHTENYSFHFTGHSLGGALATLAAVDFQAMHRIETERVSCMSFGAPKAGNFGFAKIYNELVPQSFRIVNDTDLVARMPRSYNGGSILSRYKHAGRTVLINDHGQFWIEGYNDSTLDDDRNGISDPFRERFKDLNDLIAMEQKLWQELVSGKSVQHHMEDAYFVTMHRVMMNYFESRIG